MLFTQLFNICDLNHIDRYLESRKDSESDIATSKFWLAI